LSDTNGFNHHQVAAGCIKHSGGIGGRSSEPSERTTRGHTSNIDPMIGVMVLHPYAIAQNRSARVGTRRVNRNDSHGLILFAVMLGELVDQSALAGSRSSGEPDDTRVPSVRKERLEQVGPAGEAILNDGNGAGECAGVAGAETVNERWKRWVQTV
jgi:hypothetical protein